MDIRIQIRRDRFRELLDDLDVAAVVTTRDDKPLVQPVHGLKAAPRG